MLAAFIEKFVPNRTVFLPDPCPALHKAVLSDARVAWQTYAYHDTETQTLCFERMLNNLMEMPNGSFVFIHGFLITVTRQMSMVCLRLCP